MLSTKFKPFLSCQKESKLFSKQILFKICSPLCPKGLCPMSCAIEIALVKVVFKPKDFAIV